jgi:CHAD domain-containing protein
MAANPPSFREYGFQVVGERLAVLLSHAEGVRRAEDIEALHDMRVASRRLRAALSLFRDAFPPGPFRRFDAEVKAITDALGEARDLDVMIETLEKIEKGMDESERSGLHSFLERKRRRRARLQRDIVAALDRVEVVDLPRRLAAMCIVPQPAAPTPAPEPTEA